VGSQKQLGKLAIELKASPNNGDLAFAFREFALGSYPSKEIGTTIKKKKAKQESLEYH